MPKYKLTYFDASVSRGEECRLALFLAGADFEDNRLAREAWTALKPTTPFGAVPVLEVEGKPPLAQSNAILGFVGRNLGFGPKDPWEVARHDAILQAVEDLRAALAPSGKISDPEQKKRAREELAAGLLQTWGGQIEAQIRGPFVSGSELGVADIKLFVISSSFRRGALDHIPSDVFAKFPKLHALHDKVAEHPKVAEWRSKH